MEKGNTNRLSREDWVRGALELLRTDGVKGVKIVPLAERLGVTSGSFYWHFRNRRELYDALVDYWEREMTDVAIEAARAFEGLPGERIWHLMEQVMSTGMAHLDLAFWHWAQSDADARRIFRRVLKKRFLFASWMFSEAGFSEEQARVRGRMMVVYMMGESTLIPETLKRRRESLKLKFAILTAPEQ